MRSYIMEFGSKPNVAITRNSSPSSWSSFSLSSPPTCPITTTCAPSTCMSICFMSSSPVGTCTNLNRAPIPCKSGSGRSRNGCKQLEALNSSCPPCASLLRIDSLDKTDIDVESHYRLWILRHPSALACFDRIMEVANEKKVAIFLDYDGTLSPIVDDPDSAFMSDMMRVTVKEVAMHFPVAIISGRCRDKVYDFVQLPELYYAGSHGMDIMGPAMGCISNGNSNGTNSFDVKGNKVVLFQPVGDLPCIIEEACRELEEKTKHIDGVRIENNKFCATIHFRCVNKEDWNSLLEHVEEVIRYYPSLCLTQGRKVLEIRPIMAWNKGKALQFLLNVLGLHDCNNVFPIYIGDDRTDEDAFRVVNNMGHGLGILVSNTPKDTTAIYSLQDPCEVLKFLKDLVNWKINLMRSINP